MNQNTETITGRAAEVVHAYSLLVPTSEENKRILSALVAASIRDAIDEVAQGLFKSPGMLSQAGRDLRSMINDCA